METGKPGLVSAPVHISPIAALTEKKMDIQAPLTALYIHTVPALPAQPYLQPPAAAQESSAIQLAVPPLYSKDTLPVLTLHIAGGLQCQLQGLSVAAAPTARAKSAGKHVCPHCGRDCMKPSVLEKHLRCHTGERPYPCATCGVSFKTQSNLYKHKRTQAHARLSSESEQSSMGSQDSLSSSRETCTSSLSLEDHSEELDTIEKAKTTAGEIASPASTAKVCSAKTQSSIGEENEPTEANANGKLTKGEEKQRTENEKTPVTLSRHLPLQRQEATLFSKQWESSVCRGKSQSHESTDSGFSESSDQYPSPGSVLPDHSMDSLTESTKEHLEDTRQLSHTHRTRPKWTGAKDTTRQQEQKNLAERISKLISENSAVVEDKQLENVRPRKTVLSKQGSIDLPMPYTYKDSFHFDMRIGKSTNVEVQRNRNPGLYSSVPTQPSTTMSHAPLTRSNSLPFSVALLQPERSSPSHSDYVTLIRRGSSGQINPTGFSIKTVNQQSSTHRPLVRQTAVDCNHAPDAPFMNSSVEEASTGSLSCDGDGGDICGEPSNRKFRRKKTQKFAYNKWYMYGGGTFKKLYSAEKTGDGGVSKSTKSVPNPDRGVVQGIQRSLSVVQKETVTTTGSTINFTTTCHPSCTPARLPFVASVDLSSKPRQLQAPCSSLRRNLSLSALPLPSIGSLATHNTDRLSRAKTTEQHTCSTLQPGEAYIPSDRKKQKTDDKTIHPLEMEITPNKLTHRPPSVTGNVPQQDTKLTSSNPNANFIQFKEALFPSCIINVNTPSMSTPPATASPPTAKTSFLPKYQLKLPSAAEPTPTPSLQAASQPSEPDHCSLNSGRSSCQNKQPSFSAPEKKCEEQTRDFAAPATVLCQAETFASRPEHNGTTNSAVDCQQLATNTTTLTYVHGFHTGSCSTSMQNLSLRTSLAPTPMQIHLTAENNPSAPATPSGNIQPASSAITPFSQDSKTHSSVASETSVPVNGATAASNTPVLPGPIVPYDLVQPTAQNVFHVHTSDLQICFQIISDEQLALIEPQIERQVTSAGSTFSQRCDVEAEETQKRPQISVAMESTNEEKPGQQKEVNQSEALLLLNMEKLKPPLSAHFEKAQPHAFITQDGNSSQAALSDELKPSEALSSSLHPPKYNHVNMPTETLTSTCDVASQQSGQNQKPEAECGLSQHGCTEEQAGTVCETPAGPQTLCPANITSLTPNTSQQNRVGGTLQFKETRQKTTTHGGLFNGGTMKTMSQTSAYESSSLEIAESVSRAPVALRLSSTPASCADDPMESSSSENICSTTHANMERDRVVPLNGSAALQETTLCESQEIISPSHAEKQLGQFTPESYNIHVETATALLTAIQSPTAGLTAGVSITDCGAQTEKERHGGTPGQSRSSDCKPQESQEARETNHRCTGPQDRSEMVGEDRGTRTVGVDKGPGECRKCACRHSPSTDWTNPGGEERKSLVDSIKNSWYHLSQTHPALSEYLPQTPQHGPHTSNNLSSPPGTQTSVFNPSQPQLQMNSLYFPHQHWESSAAHHQHLCQTNSTPPLPQQVQSAQPESPFPQTPLRQTFSQLDHSRQTCVTVPIQQVTCTAGGSMTSSCCSKSTAGSHRSKHVSLSSDITTSLSSPVSPSVHTSVSNSAVTRDIWATNRASDVTAGQPLKPPASMNQEPNGNHESKDYTTYDYTTQSGNTAGDDVTSKYQSYFLVGQLHSYQPECMATVVRPVPNCQDYADGTSSSDDEGKLIIEL